MPTVKKTRGKKGISYHFRTYSGYNIEGKQIVQSMTWHPPENMTEKQADKEAQRQAYLFEEKCRRGIVLDCSMTLAEYAEIWMRDYAKVRLRPKTIASYELYLRRILAALGHIRMDRIQPVHLSEFYRNLQEVGIREDGKYKSSQVRALIKDMGYTQVRFAALCGIGEVTIRSVCKGNPVNKETAERISAALGLPLKSLFVGTGKQKRTLSADTVRKHHRVLSSLLSTAVKQQIIFSNPCERVEIPRPDHAEAEYLDEEEAAELLRLLQSEPTQFRTAVELLLYTGLRRGELCGLEWQDIDFEKSLLTVSRTSQYLSDRGVFTDETKNRSSRRVIKLSASAVTLLREYRIWQLQERLKLGDQWQDCGRLFTTWNGAPIHPDTITRWFRAFCKKNGFSDGLHIHSLRHTNATLLIASGVNVRTVASRLGHADANTTNKIYSHAIKSADAAAAEVLDDILHPIRKVSDA